MNSSWWFLWWYAPSYIFGASFKFCLDLTSCYFNLPNLVLIRNLSFWLPFRVLSTFYIVWLNSVGIYFNVFALFVCTPRYFCDCVIAIYIVYGLWPPSKSQDDFWRIFSYFHLCPYNTHSRVLHLVGYCQCKILSYTNIKKKKTFLWILFILFSSVLCIAIEIHI